MGLAPYLCVSVGLLVIGLACMIARRNILYVLMGLEMVLNAANVNLVAFAHFQGARLDGRIFALFMIIVAAAEAAVALAIILNVVQLFHTVKPGAVDRLRE
jgi:NADH-quinone oxidoreductase subunit K